MSRGLVGCERRKGGGRVLIVMARDACAMGNFRLLAGCVVGVCGG